MIPYQLPRMSNSVLRPPYVDHVKMPPPSSSATKPEYAPSTYSTSTTQTEKPLLTSEETTSSKNSKRTKAWKKTKKFLSSIGEPPTAEYDRQMAPKDETEEEKLKRLRKFGELDYGPYRGGPQSGRVWT